MPNLRCMGGREHLQKDLKMGPRILQPPPRPACFQIYLTEIVTQRATTMSLLFRSLKKTTLGC